MPHPPIEIDGRITGIVSLKPVLGSYRHNRIRFSCKMFYLIGLGRSAWMCVRREITRLPRTDYHFGLEHRHPRADYPNTAQMELRGNMNRGRTMAAMANTAVHPIRSRNSGTGEGRSLKPIGKMPAYTAALRPAGDEMPEKADSNTESTSA